MFANAHLAAGLGLACLVRWATAQSDDVIWHNRYHAILAMSAYGDYKTLCPQQTFTVAAALKNFPNNTLPTFEILEEWGPTAHGSSGYTVLVPEMAKVVLVFKGDYNIEKNLPTQSTSIAALNPDFDLRSVPFDKLGVPAGCTDCTVNQYALMGYLEAKQATNNFAKSVAKYREIHDSQQFYYSITGHGLGGMHSLIASLDLGLQNISFFTHSYGAPRTFSPSTAKIYDYLYGGDMTERGITNADSFVTSIPAGPDYAFTNTAFLWWGYNASFVMNRVVCYEEAESPYCMPTQSPTPELDHYFAFTNVGQCGGAARQNTTIAQNFINSVLNTSITRASLQAQLGPAVSGAVSVSTSLPSVVANATSTGLRASSIVSGAGSTAVGGIAGAAAAATTGTPATAANDTSASASAHTKSSASLSAAPAGALAFVAAGMALYAL